MKPFVTLLIAALCVVAGTAAIDLPQQHPSGYAHMDCSSCLAVAHVLSDKMNKSLLASSSSFLSSHRLDTANQLKRVQYADSELRAAEVLEDACNKEVYEWYHLRVNPLTKVRGYHFFYYSHIQAVTRPILLEGVAFPANSTYEDDRPSKMAAVAQLYSTSEKKKLGPLHKNAPASLCVQIMAEAEEEIEDMVRHAQYQWEVERHLCGLDIGPWWPEEGEQEEDEYNVRRPRWEGLEEPVLQVCAASHPIAEDARKDQVLWQRWTDIRERKKQEAAVRHSRRFLDAEDEEL
ncbi:hypothetical protein STCU_06426 [Strigomonas culicis]|uniref:DUF3456 domain-containing protein n=1 Tax=Strigomonas culicis TaxID=28005 RepID=S9UAW3_9TRYP|nr:hypothetical protein STCU_06426 [Strigomonas culicis]|eukprot:EPY25889.1 hypothetical protein STCU_06426 [Strigomonas culicis]